MKRDYYDQGFSVSMDLHQLNDEKNKLRSSTHERLMSHGTHCKPNASISI